MKKPFLGFHFDIARGCYLRPETFCRALKMAANSGYTHFLPYLENMIRLPSIANACPPCAYTPEDWRGFDSVAREAGIELVPHFNVIGHSELIVPSYPELGEETDRGHMDLDVEREATRAWTKRCLGEFCDFSNGEYFLIGGDEWQPPRRLLARPGFDAAKAWVNQINLAIEFLEARGRKPIVWHDMLVHFPAALQSLSRKAVIAFWFYDEDSDHAALDMFKQHGFETLMASAVFDGASPWLSRRSLAALRCATASATRHRCHGMIVTTWEQVRWEYQTANIPLAASVIRGEEPAAAMVEAFTAIGAWRKLPPELPLAGAWKARAIKLLDDPAWKSFPELKRCLSADLRGDRKESVASYEVFHHPLGRLYDAPEAARPAAVGAPEPVAMTGQYDAAGFELKVETHPKAGEVLRFINGDERFVVYPKYGATLQDWRKSGDVVIPEGMENFLKRDALPGGYRSYAAAGGFRPIWALGTHSNPCILWQYPWRWRTVERNANKVTVEFDLELAHGSFTVQVMIERGRSGFAYECRARNKVEHAHGAFNFNLPLLLSHEDIAGMKLVWHSGETTIAANGQSAFWVPVRGGLRIVRPGWTLEIEAAPDQTAGYFVDWVPGVYVTPDLHGVYRKLRVCEETITRWRFSLARQ